MTCDYKPAPQNASDEQGGERIVLDRFVISFNIAKESEMYVALTFTNAGATAISEARIAYLAIDDDAGHNYLRRPLPQVDFRKLAPSQSFTFSDHFYCGAFLPGHYKLHLWVPSPDQSLKFDNRHNLLLASEGVPDPSTGLNVLGDFKRER